MPQLIKNECKKMFLPVLLTTAALTIIMCVLIEKLYLSYTLHYDLEAWDFPALSAVCCDSALLESVLRA